MERVASWAVPAAELLVPVLALLGRPRAAGAVALASIVVFSVALVRLALRDGARVSCGCFGRGSIDVRLALARNVALAAAAAVVVVLGRSRIRRSACPTEATRCPRCSSPARWSSPAVTVWRTSVWLGRGRA